MLKILLLTLLSLLAFSGNSVLCRLALMEPLIDAASFTSIRLVSGALVLAALIFFQPSLRNKPPSKASWSGATALFIYAVAFSYAYILLDTGVGALLLFGAVQITLIIFARLLETIPLKGELLGVALAFSGFLYLVWPEVTRPSISGMVLMTIAGVAWAIYTLVGKGSSNPIYDTAVNFLRTLPMVLILILLTLPTLTVTWEGAAFAVASGGITSGLGYAVWYVVVKQFSATQAGVVQLLVPIIAAIGGVMFAGEALSLHLIVSAVLTLGGVVTVMFARKSLSIQR